MAAVSDCCLQNLPCHQISRHADVATSSLMMEPITPLSAVAASLPERDVRPWQKLVSASCGALLTSMVTMPLEVVKTRMQAVLPSQRTTGSLPARASTATVALQIIRNEGVFALWSGLKPSLLMQLPSTALYFTAYDELKRKLEDAGGGPHSGSVLTSYAPLISGIVSRSATATAVAPLELLRTMAMHRQSSVASGLWSTLSSQVSSNGYASLWRGLGPTLARDVPFSGVYWLGYERIKAAILPSVIMSMGGPGAGSAFVSSLLSGLIAGSVAAFITTPADVAKTRRQVLLYEEAAVAAGQSKSASGYAGVPAPTSTIALLRSIAAEEGMPGLFAGVGVRVARVGPACAIMISAYEVGKWAFLKQADPGDEKDGSEV